MQDTGLKKAWELPRVQREGRACNDVAPHLWGTAAKWTGANRWRMTISALASLQTRASDSGLAFWGEGSGERGDDDDTVMQTSRTTSPEEPFYSVFPVLS